MGAKAGATPRPHSRGEPDARERPTDTDADTDTDTDTDADTHTDADADTRLGDAMSAGITVDALTKRYGPVAAVDGLSFTVEPGLVTGFLGPNGAGKTTTLRMLLGLVTPTSGTALIDGRPYAGLRRPRRVVGAVLEATGFHPGRRGRDHLRVLAQAGGIAPSRVDEVLEQVGLGDAGGRRVGGYSLGMRQRLGLASALLGDPQVLVLDEPANGLDPAGMADLRDLLRGLAAEGRTVLMSSHVLSEVAQTVDRVVIVAGGTLRHAGPLAELTAAQGETLEAAFLRLTATPDTDPSGAVTAPVRG
ncbi:ABC transporter ATP-binding protein [Streptacidiphilus jiangxiensis]|uniref:ABC-2 type transport system ATP-binding protein n=1 Tax=Streptacidiphilus jiangxiensis TaxID=235985 RepID=A0A1H7N6Y7_STRJI|nr:ABC-2 type transport system ATP-binding protein [Streptacidiphilus jiangxiensis]